MKNKSNKVNEWKLRLFLFIPVDTHINVKI